MKPTIVISKCLGFEGCRYDGSMIRFDLLENMKDKINFIVVCPEMAVGLPVPRESLRLVKSKEEIGLIQPATGKDFTRDMISYSRELFEKLPTIHGFILKGRSPSCGIKDVKIYAGAAKSPVVEKGAGVFAQMVAEAYPNLPIEEEGRLMNLEIREHFFTAVYLLLRFEQVKKAGTIKALSEFQAANKYLFFAYHQGQKDKLGSIAGNHEKKSLEVVIEDYGRELSGLLSQMPSVKNYINAFQHILGYFSKQLSAQEKGFVLDLLRKYRNHQLDKSAVASVLKGYAIQYGQDYLLNQTIFEPFPEELISLSDTGK